MFKAAQQEPDDEEMVEPVRTANGAISCSPSSMDPRVLLFFKLVRTAVDSPNFEKWIAQSWSKSPSDTLKILMHGRDCRGGKGDRDPFFQAINLLVKQGDESVERAVLSNLHLLKDYGRFLDLIELDALCSNVHLTNTVVKIMADQVIEDKAALETGDYHNLSLVAKWIPSENAKWDRKTRLLDHIIPVVFSNVESVANFHKDKKTRNYFYKRWRTEYITPLRTVLKIVERHMCLDEWDQIKFSAVPSRAMLKLRKAFKKHTPELFEQWLLELKTGKSKVNAKQLDPHELVSQYLTKHIDEDPVIEAQWTALVQSVKDKGQLKGALALPDVSGSMDGQPMEIAIALGLLISSVAAEPFKGALLPFSTKPTFFDLDVTDTLHKNVAKVAQMEWQGSTDLQAAFRQILTRAIQHKVAKENMPTTLYIISDMQFNEADNKYMTNYQSLKVQYEQAGYDIPSIVFWNVNSSVSIADEIPINNVNEANVALVSGFSPSLLQFIMNCKDLTPYNLMRSVIDSERYDPVVVPDDISDHIDYVRTAPIPIADTTVVDAYNTSTYTTYTPYESECESENDKYWRLEVEKVFMI